MNRVWSLFGVAWSFLRLIALYICVFFLLGTIDTAQGMIIIAMAAGTATTALLFFYNFQNPSHAQLFHAPLMIGAGSGFAISSLGLLLLVLNVVRGVMVPLGLQTMISFVVLGITVAGDLLLLVTLVAQGTKFHGGDQNP